MNTLPLFSIVINNYNYAHYLRDSIDSALAQNYSPVEVVVVDDGSTDSSREFIESYGDKIISVFQQNGGQGAAVNAGFKQSKGQWVIFLDSDDKLAPNTVEEVMREARTGTAIVQYYLTVIDEKGGPTGVRLPTRPLHNGDVRDILAKFRYYNSPPSSGNAYARGFLEKVLPMPPDRWRISADAYLILSAPFYGFLASIHSELGFYRRHGGGASDSAVADLSGLRAYASKELKKEIKRELYVRNVLRQHNYLPFVKSYLSPTYCKFRLLDSELQRGNISIHERIELAWHILVCAAKWPNYTLAHRCIFTAWCILVLLLPLNLMLQFVRRTMLPHWRGRGGLNQFWQVKG